MGLFSFSSNTASTLSHQKCNPLYEAEISHSLERRRSKKTESRAQPNGGHARRKQKQRWMFSLRSDVKDVHKGEGRGERRSLEDEDYLSDLEDEKRSEEEQLSRPRRKCYGLFGKKWR